MYHVTLIPFYMAILQRLRGGRSYMSRIRERRINKPAHIRQLMQEQINILRQDDSLDKIERARAIGYLANIALNAYREGDLVEKVVSIEEWLKDKGGSKWSGLG